MLSQIKPADSNQDNNHEEENHERLFEDMLVMLPYGVKEKTIKCNGGCGVETRERRSGFRIQDRQRSDPIYQEL